MILTRVVLLVVSVLAVLLAISVPLVIRYLSRATGFTEATETTPSIISSDTGAAAPIVVRDAELGVRGVPDYLVTVEIDGRRAIAPVELKPRRTHRKLLQSDRLQVGTYLVGLRGTVGSAASPVGFVNYRSSRFVVRLTPALEQQVRGTVMAIRRDRSADIVHRSHNSAAKCRGCAVRASCDESLAD